MEVLRGFPRGILDASAGVGVGVEAWAAEGADAIGCGYPPNAYLVTKKRGKNRIVIIFRSLDHKKSIYPDDWIQKYQLRNKAFKDRTPPIQFFTILYYFIEG